MRVLITGSTGLIGHAVAARLREEHEVLGFDLRPGPLTNVIGDINDTRLMDSLVAQSDSIVHLAALLTPHISTHSEAAFFETNVRGTEVLLDAARRHHVSRFVFTSTTSIYGDAMIPRSGAVWVTEDLPPQPRDVYDRTKLAAEALCREAAADGVMRCIALRMSRCFPEPPALMAVYRLYRGVDRRDVADAHALSLVRDVPNFAIYNVSAQTPFEPEDTGQLLADAPAILRRRCPLFVSEFLRRGWPLPMQIDRVYVTKRARLELGYRPRFGFAEYLKEYDLSAADSA